MMNGNIELVRAIRSTFDEEETRTLCFQLAVEYDDLPAANRAGKVRELVRLCERNGTLDALILACMSERPNEYWVDKASQVSPAAIQFMLPKMSLGSATRLMGMELARLTKITQTAAIRMDGADADRSRVKMIAAVDLALTAYLVLASIFS